MQPAGASVNFKVNDGTDDLYWDGAQWSVAGASDWNTEAEVAAHIAALPATSRTLALVINMVTTDKYVTPTLAAVGVLMNCDIDYLLSLVGDSLIPSLCAALQITTQLGALADGTAEVSLVSVSNKWNIVSVDAVYNHTNDSSHDTDLLSSYDSSTHIVTLTSAQAANDKLWVVLTIEPEAGLLWGGEDYGELSSVPAVIIESIEESGSEVAARFDVPNADDNTCVSRFQAIDTRLEFGILLVAGNGRTLLQLKSKAIKNASGVLAWAALDESFWFTRTGVGFRPRPSIGKVRSAGYSLVLNHVYVWTSAEEQGYLVEQLQPTLTAPTLEGGPRWTG